MKRIISLLVMVTYMASAIGIGFSFHYCGNQFKHISFSADTEKGCCGKSGHKRNCCKDVVVKVKYNSDHTISGKAVAAKIFIVSGILPIYHDQKNRSSEAECRTFAANDSSPPFTSHLPIYLLNRALRI